VQSFVGREDELTRLDSGVTKLGEQSGRVVIFAMSGTAGVGKTALAVHWAHKVRDRFPDGQLYVNLRGFDPTGPAMAPGDALRGFLDALDIRTHRIPTSLEAQSGLFRSLLATRRVLLVLDNARDADQVRPLLPGGPGPLVLITSRDQLTGLVVAEGAHPLTLDKLTVAEARDLLAHRLGPSRLTAEPGATNEIIARCAGLPLALAITAARAATHPGFPLAALADQLREARGRLDALTSGEPAADLRAVFSWSYHALKDDAGGLFRLLGLHLGPDITATAAASLAGLPLKEVRPLLAELARAHLIAEAVPGRYTVHDLLRSYASELAHSFDRNTSRGAALHRMLDHYLYTAHAAALLIDPHREPVTLPLPQPGVTPESLQGRDQGLRWLVAEHRVLLTSVEQAYQAGLHRHAWQLAWALTGFLDRRGHWLDWVASQRTALAAAERSSDRNGLAYAHRYLGFACARTGRHDEAASHLNQALEWFRRLGDQIGEARTHLDVGMLMEHLGQRGEAISHDRRALDLFRSAGSVTGQARALNSLGWDLSQVGNHVEAIIHCQEALLLHQEIGDRNGEAAVWDTLGRAHHHLGQHQDAISCYRQSLTLNRSLGSRYFEADTLTRLGETYEAVGNLGEACKAWRRAVDILDELRHPDSAQVRARLRPDRLVPRSGSR
jgi:tetratricopeptide (TPR) repeat protein